MLNQQESDPAERDLVLSGRRPCRNVSTAGVEGGAKMKVGQLYQRGGGSWLVTEQLSHLKGEMELQPCRGSCCVVFHTQLRYVVLVM